MKNNTYAPILLFTYKRLDTLQSTVSALQQNDHAKDSDLFIFSDAAKTLHDCSIIKEVRKYIHSVKGFRKINIIEASHNKGLANSIISGVTQVINIHGKVIVLEDDLITSSNFLSYMNQCLNYYKNDKDVFTISGYTFPLKDTKGKDIYFTKRSSSWGWATWSDRWSKVDWNVGDYSIFRNDQNQRKAFNCMGSDLTTLLDRQMNGKRDSWLIRLLYHQFKENSYTVFPTTSKVRNIGFGDSEATHTFDIFNRFETTIDRTKRKEFVLSEPFIDEEVLKGFLDKFSIRTRIKYKILNSIARTVRWKSYNVPKIESIE